MHSFALLATCAVGAIGFVIQTVTPVPQLKPNFNLNPNDGRRGSNSRRTQVVKAVSSYEPYEQEGSHFQEMEVLQFERELRRQFPEIVLNCQQSVKCTEPLLLQRDILDVYCGGLAVPTIDEVRRVPTFLLQGDQQMLQVVRSVICKYWDGRGSIYLPKMPVFVGPGTVLTLGRAGDSLADSIYASIGTDMDIHLIGSSLSKEAAEEFREIQDTHAECGHLISFKTNPVVIDGTNYISYMQTVDQTSIVAAYPDDEICDYGFVDRLISILQANDELRVVLLPQQPKSPGMKYAMAFGDDVVSLEKSSKAFFGRSEFAGPDDVTIKVSRREIAAHMYSVMQIGVSLAPNDSVFFNDGTTVNGGSSTGGKSGWTGPPRRGFYDI